MPQKNSLGKGLGAILSSAVDDLNTRPTFIICGIEELYPNRFQPRKDFNDEAQQQLVASLKQSGIIQPIVVRKTEKGYEIIAGERRWRAAQAARFQDVPIIIREAGDMEVAELSLVENIQREELNAVEEANAYQTLMDKFGLSQEDLSTRVGKDRSTIANTVRLLKLPPEAKTSLIEKKITPGHARSLLALNSAQEQMQVLHLIVKKGLNVRETERLIKSLKEAPDGRTKAPADPQIVELEKKLSARMMAKVRIKYGKKLGAIEIIFSGKEEFNRLMNILTGAD
ncbi:MAG: ParB/RepB/Spo0J family partition protein [Deltaproteobacteria bacterium]|nr:ParB/RepB/Spo0J family partition protein [Deltaproteobacteria bacterium]